MTQPADSTVAAENQSNKKDVKKEEEPDELSEEDQALKDSLEGLVAQLTDAKEETVSNTISLIAKKIREATTSMTSVPKPLKFLRPKYITVKAAHETVPEGCKKALADIVSILATVSCDEGEREALEFCLKGSGADPGSWGHEYMRHLAGEIAAEHAHRISQEPAESVEDLMSLVTVCFHLLSSESSPLRALLLAAHTGCRPRLYPLDAVQSMQSIVSGLIKLHDLFLLQCISLPTHNNQSATVPLSAAAALPSFPCNLCWT
jgi:26S proteasome regulatory subunit N1